MKNKYLDELISSSEVSDVKGTKLYDSGKEGPTIGIMCMTHGNEFAGVETIEAALSDIRSITRGRVIVTCNNILAAQKNVRFMDRNMNRIFDPAMISDGYESERLDEIFPVLNQMEIAIDLHSVPTRPETPEFTIIPGATPEQIELASQLDSTFQVLYPYKINETASSSDYMLDQGTPCLTYECGPEKTYDLEKAVMNIRRFLRYTGVSDIATEPFPESIWTSCNQTEQFTDIAGFNFAEDFPMESFQFVEKGKLIATDKDNEYRVNADSYTLFTNPPSSYRSRNKALNEPFVYLAEKIKNPSK